MKWILGLPELLFNHNRWVIQFQVFDVPLWLPEVFSLLSLYLLQVQLQLRLVHLLKTLFVQIFSTDVAVKAGRSSVLD